MGASYFAIPFSDSAAQAVFEQKGAALPDGWERSRNPSPNELRRVLESLPGWRSDIHPGPGRWQASVEDPSDPHAYGALIDVRDYRGDADSPHGFVFSRADPELAMQITERLTHTCGPLLFFCDSGGPDVLISAGTDVGKAFALWESACEEDWGLEAEEGG
jgi:hypothetical protein